MWIRNGAFPSTNPASSAITPNWIRTPELNWDAQKVRLDAGCIEKIDALDEGQRHAKLPFAPKW
jgi:hypothetical protein